MDNIKMDVSRHHLIFFRRTIIRSYKSSEEPIT